MSMHPTATVEAIMSSEVLEWRADTEKQDAVRAEAQGNLYDYLPVNRGGQIVSVLDVGSGEEVPLTRDWLVTRDTPIPDLLKLMADSKRTAFFVLGGQRVLGVVTPSDLNKVTAKSYFYSELAALEMALANRARSFYGGNSDRIVELIKPAEKTVPQYRQKIRGRARSNDREELGLDLVHLLELGELTVLLQNDPDFRAEFLMASSESVDIHFSGIADLRNKVMHTNRLILGDRYGLKEVRDVLERVQRLIERFSIAD